MELTSLTAISPLDGRYRQHVEPLDAYFSEFALMKYRVLVEVEYFLLLAQKGFFELDAKAKNALRHLTDNFSTDDADAIKAIEKTTNHDVKAVEYFIKSALARADAGQNVREFVHFGLTSQDVNNTAIPLSWKHALEHEYLPALLNLQHHLLQLAQQWAAVPMLARTHGQAASPTRLGKELMVFAERIDNQVQLLSYIPYAAKFGGATGNFNAHHVAFPHTDWIGFADHFVEDILGLQRMQFTTQIEHYDSLAAHFDAIKRINNILLGLCRDLWTYVSLDYFKQKTKAGEVGSSAMPHKVNPIDFENAEGNLGMANALLEHLAAKLPISRLQRDLTDSTVLRNLGAPMAHTMIALAALDKGLKKLVLNAPKLEADLEANWTVVAEGIQTILRRENYPNPYEALKDLTRGADGINQQSLWAFVDGLNVSPAVKAELKAMSPHNYTGISPDF
jgi:adenylosuccinate lyase